jgi:hypothetical protein
MAEQRPEWEANLSGVLGDAPATNQLLDAPIYLAAGATDNALPNSQAVRDIFEEHQIKVLWQDSSLGHEWGNWRRYLAQTLPLMFKNTSGCNWGVGGGAFAAPPNYEDPHLAGSIDELRIYGAALSEAQVGASAGFGANPSFL